MRGIEYIELLELYITALRSVFINGRSGDYLYASIATVRHLLKPQL
jgi:hypothetical protein